MAAPDALSPSRWIPSPSLSGGFLKKEKIREIRSNIHTLEKWQGIPTPFFFTIRLSHHLYCTFLYHTFLFLAVLIHQFLKINVPVSHHIKLRCTCITLSTYWWLLYTHQLNRPVHISQSVQFFLRLVQFFLRPVLPTKPPSRLTKRCPLLYRHLRVLPLNYHIIRGVSPHHQSALNSSRIIQSSSPSTHYSISHHLLPLSRHFSHRLSLTL